jgi:broad specificity polyphosphatase/5'/3'-nucleotidase SurE
LKETAVTFPSIRHYQDNLEILKTQGRHRYCMIGFGIVESKAEEGSDADMVAKGIVSVSPVFIHPVVRRDLCVSAPAYTAVDPRPEV